MTAVYDYSERLRLLESNGFVQKKGCITNGKYSFLYHQIDTSEITDEEFTNFINLIKSEQHETTFIL
jgi:predicted transcriptional regulator